MGIFGRGRPSFRVRMVVFPVAISAVGLLVFALLSLGFFQREVRRNLERDLSGTLLRAAPVLTRIAGPARPRLDDWMTARLEGRLAEFGATYAVRAADSPGWRFGPGWPVEDPGRLERLADKLPATPLPPGWFRRGAGPAERSRTARAPGDRSGPVSVRDVWVGTGEGWPGDWLVAGLRGPDVVLLLAVPGSLERPQTKRLAAVLFLAAPFALGLVALGSYLLSGRAIAPVRRLTALASRIHAGDLSRRLSAGGLEREFAGLVEVFNAMLDRLEASFRQARRFGQDAAHELNTPLTILTGKLEEAMREAEDGSAGQRRIADLSEEVARLGEIVRKLHLLARIDGGGLKPETGIADPEPIARETVEEVAEMFPSVSFSVETEGECEGRFDPGLVRQILLNLLANAGKYNRSGGSAVVRVGRSGDGPEISVENTGPAIPEALRERIFERFARGDEARGRGTGGLGLGLSLAREYARAMGGDLVLAEGEEDRIRFVLRLPDSS